MGLERIELWRETECLQEARFAPNFTAIVRTERLAGVMRSCLQAGATIAVARRDETVCGYATVVPSSTHVFERWRDLRDVHELGALEVVRTARCQGLATGLLEQLARSLPWEDMIVFARGFVSHWDLPGTGMAAVRYRRMLVALLGRIGLTHEITDDPEVLDDPLNFLSVRYGRSVDSRSMSAFQRCLRSGAAS
jgi:acetoin utilization protein AcuA